MNITDRLQNLKSAELSSEEAQDKVAEEFLIGFAREYYNRQYRRLISAFLQGFGGWRKVFILDKQLSDKTAYADKLEKFAIEREKRIAELKKQIKDSV